MILLKATEPRDFWSGILPNIYVFIWGYLDAVKALQLMSAFLSQYSQYFITEREPTVRTINHWQRASWRG